MSMEIRVLVSTDIELMESLLALFSEAFEDKETYASKKPSKAYLQKLLGDGIVIPVVAISEGRVVGGLVAYELRKFEQERSEIYIYDLAVASDCRRQGIATALIERLKRLAEQRGAYVIFVQADTGLEDEPAIALYSKLGKREDVLHFDIPVDSKRTK